LIKERNGELSGCLSRKKGGTKIMPIFLAVYTPATANIRCWKYERTDWCFVFVVLLMILPQELLNSVME
jgi:diacylglycerol kinase